MWVFRQWVYCCNCWTLIHTHGLEETEPLAKRSVSVDGTQNITRLFSQLRGFFLVTWLEGLKKRRFCQAFKYNINTSCFHCSLDLTLYVLCMFFSRPCREVLLQAALRIQAGGNGSEEETSTGDSASSLTGTVVSHTSLMPVTDNTAFHNWVFESLFYFLNIFACSTHMKLHYSPGCSRCCDFAEPPDLISSWFIRCVKVWHNNKNWNWGALVYDFPFSYSFSWINTHIIYIFPLYL